MTQTTKIPTGDSPLIIIESVDEDVKIKGNDQSEVVIRNDEVVSYDLADQDVAAAAGDPPKAEGSAKRQSITIGPLHGDSILDVPTGASLRIGQISGDASIRSVRGGIEIDSVAEDLSASKVGEMTINSVGGDLSVKRSRGNLIVASVGEDAFCLDIEGNVELSSGGDLALQDITGNITAKAGEDATLRLSDVHGQSVTIEAGEDIACFLPDEIDATVALRSGNRTLHVRGWQLPTPPEEDIYSFTLGEGGAKIHLQAGADISLVSAQFDATKKPWIDYDIDFDFGPGFQFHFDSDSGLNPEQFTNFFSEKVQTKVQNAMRQAEEQIANALSHAESRIARAEEAAAEFENRWAGRGPKRRGDWSPSDDPGVDRRRRESRRRRGDGGRRGPGRGGSKRRGFDFDVDFGRTPPPPTAPSAPEAPGMKAPVTEEERIMVLRMVEQGKISVEQAEKLLSAMGS